MSDQALSTQDLMDLHEIRSRLPQGDPRAAKIDTLVKMQMSQPTQFEKDSIPEQWYGFLPSHLYQQAVEGVKQLASGTYGLGKDVLSKQPLATTAQKDVLAPLEDEMQKSVDLWKQGRHTEAAGHYIASYIPFLGPWAASLGEQAGKGDIGGAAAKAAAQYGAGRLSTEAVKKIPSLPGDAIRFATGASKAATERAGITAAEKQATDTAAHQQKVSDIANENRSSIAGARQAHEEKVGNIETENQRIKDEHARTVKNIRDLNDASRGAVRAGADATQASSHLAQGISDALPKIAEEETAKARAAYPKVDGAVPRNDIHAELQTIVDDKLKGSGAVPTSLSKVLGDTAEQSGAAGWGKSTGPTVGGRHFDLSNPGDLKAYQNMKAQGMFTPSEIARMEGTGGNGVSFDDLHGMYSELGRELYRGNLPGDSRAALGAARAYILSKMTDLAKNTGKLDDFNKAQRGWMVLENVFRNDRPTSTGGSPIARALNAKDPITGKLRPDYVRSILTDPKAYRVAHELLENYPDATKELRKSLGMLMQNERIAKSAPKVERIKPEPSAPAPKPLPRSASISLKETPAPPANAPFDPARFREQQMEKYAIESQKLRPYSFMSWRLPYTVIQQIISRMLLNPDFRKRLAGGGKSYAEASGYKIAQEIERIRQKLKQTGANP